jgi:hypothetical protein
MNGRARPLPQGAYCPLCGQYVALTVDGWLQAHTVPRTQAYDRFCNGERPALPQRERPRP